MITVMGATGNIGSKIARQLIDLGQDVRLVGRSPERLAAVAEGAGELRAGDPGDPEFLASAFRGASAVFTLTPYSPFDEGYLDEQSRLGEAIVQAVRASGVEKVVAISSLGAELPTGTGAIRTLHHQETRLAALAGVDVLVLRCGAFFENLLPAVEMIGAEGFYADSVAGDKLVPMIASRDIAEAAARALVDRDWSGFVIRELLGERELSYTEATQLLGSALGRPEASYVEIGDQQMIDTLTGFGMASDFAELIAELNRAMSDGTIHSLEGRRAGNTTSTSFETFAAEFAAVPVGG